MYGTARDNSAWCKASRLCAGVHRFEVSRRGQVGEISILTLVIILVAPLVVLGGLAFVLVMAYANRVSQITAKAESRPRPTVCPSCGHKLVEIRKFCAECGASIWPPESETPREQDTATRAPE